MIRFQICVVLWEILFASGEDNTENLGLIHAELMTDGVYGVREHAIAVRTSLQLMKPRDYRRRNEHKTTQH